MAKIEMAGQKFNRLAVISEHDKIGFETRWLCACDCGKTTIVMGKNLRNGATKSCGCLAREMRGLLNRRHGKHASSTYQVWADMKSRCNNSSNHAYKYYGGRGIKVCDRWASFDGFLADMGERPIGMTLDRVNTDGDYEPGNCRWATMQEQGNNRRTNIRISIGGNVRTLMQWCKEYNVSYYPARKKISMGVDAKLALGIATDQEVRRI